MISSNFLTENLISPANRIHGNNKIHSGKAGVFFGNFNIILQSIQGQKPGIIRINPSDLKNLKGLGVIEKLNKLLLAQGIDLQQTGIDANALGDLKNLLIGSGFDPEEVNTFISDLQSNIGFKSIRLSDLFAGISSLKEEQPELQEQMLDISAGANIEQVLNHLGFTPQETEQVLLNTVIKNQGIDVSLLSSNLKKVMINKEQTGLKVQDQTSSKQINELLSQIGIVSKSGAGGQMTIQHFVHELDKMVAGREQNVISSKNLFHSSNSFLNKIKSLDGKNNKANVLNISGKNTDPDTIAKKDLLNGIPISDRKPVSRELPSLQAPSTGNNNDKPAGPAHAVEMKNGLIPADENLSHALLNRKQMPDVTEGKTGLHQMITRADLSSGTNAEKKILPAYVLNQVGKQILKSVKTGDNNVKIQLKPPSLGRLQINFETGPTGMKILIVAEQLGAKELLLANINELKTSMSEQGVKLEKIDILLSQDFNQSMADARQDAKSFNKFARNRENHNNGQTDAEPDLANNREHSRPGEGTGGLDILI